MNVGLIILVKVLWLQASLVVLWINGGGGGELKESIYTVFLALVRNPRVRAKL